MELREQVFIVIDCVLPFNFRLERDPEEEEDLVTGKVAEEEKKILTLAGRNYL